MEQPFPQQQQQQHPQQQSIVTERELPMLAGIGAVVTWFEDLLNILSGPVITAGLVIALVALLTDGDLLVKVPAMLYIWSVSMALGLDAQFVGSAAKMARAARQRKWLAVFGYGVLCAALGYVGYIASNVFATQEAEGITTAQALSHLGMDGSTWILQRSLLAVILVFLSGYLRYVAPAKQAKSVALSAAEEAERLRAEIELAPLRAQARAAQIRGMRGAVLTAVGREQQQQQQPAKPSFRAAYTTPQTQPPTEHVDHLVVANNMMHDWDIPDETDGDDDPNMTTYIPTVSRPRDPRTSGAYEDTGARNTPSHSASYMSDDFDLLADDEDDADDDEYPSGSAHQRKQQKTAKGRRTQRKRTHQLEMKTQGDRDRQRAIKQATWAVRNKAEAEGIHYSEDKLVAEVNGYLAQQGSAVRTSRTAVRNWSRGWENERRHQQRNMNTGIVSDETMADLERMEVALS